MTDEQLVAALDAAQERSIAEGRARFTDAAEAARIGTIFAHDAKAYGRWRAEIDRKARRAPEGKTLGQLARDLGGEIAGLRIEHDGFEFRN